MRIARLSFMGSVWRTMPTPTEIILCALFCAPICFGLEQLGKYIYRKWKLSRKR